MKCARLACKRKCSPGCAVCDQCLDRIVNGCFSPSLSAGAEPRRDDHHVVAGHPPLAPAESDELELRALWGDR